MMNCWVARPNTNWLITHHRATTSVRILHIRWVWIEHNHHTCVLFVQDVVFPVITQKHTRSSACRSSGACCLHESMEHIFECKLNIVGQLFGVMGQRWVPPILQSYLCTYLTELDYICIFILCLKLFKFLQLVCCHCYLTDNHGTQIEEISERI